MCFNTFYKYITRLTKNLTVETREFLIQDGRKN